MAEALERRPVTEGNSEESTANCTQKQGKAWSGLEYVKYELCVIPKVGDV